MPADEKTEPREPESEVEGHRYVADEPGEEDAEKTRTRMRMKTKTKTESSDELGEDFESKTRY